MEDVIVVLGGATEAAVETAVARKTCTNCNTEQNIDQFLHARGNGRIVVNCLSCRHKKRLHVISLVTIFFSSANLSQVQASRASIEISRAIARGENLPLPFAPALAPGVDETLHTASLPRCITKGVAFLQIPQKWQPHGIND